MSARGNILEAVDIDWVGVYDPQNRMTVRDRAELGTLFRRAIRQARADGVREGVDACASVAKDRAEIAFLPGDRGKWERSVALQIEARCRRIIAVHTADPNRAAAEPEAKEKPACPVCGRSGYPFGQFSADGCAICGRQPAPVPVVCNYCEKPMAECRCDAPSAR